MRATTFDEVRRRLERELASRGGNMRQLARDIADRDETGLETARRALYRILRDGQVPTIETSQLLEHGLGKNAGYFTVKREESRARRDRLAELEAEVSGLKAALRLAGEAHDELLERVAALEARGRRRGAG